MSLAPLVRAGHAVVPVEVSPAVSPAVSEGGPLPLPAGSWGADQARRALAEASDRLPVAVPEVWGATVMSVLTTVVLRSGPFAVKVYPPGTEPSHLDRLAAALSGSRTAHLPLGPAVQTTYGVVTVTPWLAAARPVTWPELGELLARFHAEHAAAPVRPWAPLSRLPTQVASLPEPAAQLLLAARDALLAALEGTRSGLGVGVVHGDLSPGNAMRCGRHPLLIDLDWVALAPREYDLSGAARRFRAGEMSRRTYRRFCAAYGADVTTWAGLPVLDRIADLGGVAFRLWDDRFHGRDLGWLPEELRRWRCPL